MQSHKEHFQERRLSDPRKNFRDHRDLCSVRFLHVKAVLQTKVYRELQTLEQVRAKRKTKLPLSVPFCHPW